MATFCSHMPSTPVEPHRVSSGYDSQPWPVKYASMANAHAAVCMFCSRRKEKVKYSGDRTPLQNLHLNSLPRVWVWAPYPLTRGKGYKLFFSLLA